MNPEDLTQPGYAQYCKPICKARKLYKICTIKTEHPARGYECFFDPTQAEILRQIPKDIVGEVVAFKTKPARTKLERICFNQIMFMGRQHCMGFDLMPSCQKK